MPKQEDILPAKSATEAKKKVKKQRARQASGGLFLSQFYASNNGDIIANQNKNGRFSATKNSRFLQILSHFLLRFL